MKAEDKLGFQEIKIPDDKEYNNQRYPNAPLPKIPVAQGMYSNPVPAENWDYDHDEFDFEDKLSDQTGIRESLVSPKGSVTYCIIIKSTDGVPLIILKILFIIILSPIWIVISIFVFAFLLLKVIWKKKGKICKFIANIIKDVIVALFFSFYGLFIILRFGFTYGIINIGEGSLHAIQVLVFILLYLVRMIDISLKIPVQILLLLLEAVYHFANTAFFLLSKIYNSSKMLFLTIFYIARLATLGLLHFLISSSALLLVLSKHLLNSAQNTLKTSLFLAVHIYINQARFSLATLRYLSQEYLLLMFRALSVNLVLVKILRKRMNGKSFKKIKEFAKILKNGVVYMLELESRGAVLSGRAAFKFGKHAGLAAGRATAHFSTALAWASSNEVRAIRAAVSGGIFTAFFLGFKHAALFALFYLYMLGIAFVDLFLTLFIILRTLSIAIFYTLLWPFESVYRDTGIVLAGIALVIGIFLWKILSFSAKKVWGILKIVGSWLWMVIKKVLLFLWKIFKEILKVIWIIVKFISNIIAIILKAIFKVVAAIAAFIWKGISAVARVIGGVFRSIGQAIGRLF